MFTKKRASATMRTLKIKFYGSLVVLVLLALYALASEMSYHDALVERQQYCDMVRLHQHNPAVGWPDYRGIYRSECVQHPAKQASLTRNQNDRD